MDEGPRSGQPRSDRAGPVTASGAYPGSPADIVEARDLARDFLTRAWADHGRPVSDRAMDVVQLVVSELVTNACKHAPGPCLVDLELSGGSVRITVRDSAPELPVARAADPGRVGQHGLEIVTAVCQGFEVHREPLGERTTASVVLADGVPADGSAGDAAGRAPAP
ncbi:ATP-binding protein [Streptomyces sp. NRRL S-1022]|uniref:ATP-binding protein n=1 Tax=Streptomyces sp. NRRL S-1022 TaxID=1463880 RepID=UPI0004C261BA|nr:ATP-binding protein [Streptomyces sp. NRRL S-1022]